MQTSAWVFVWPLFDGDSFVKDTFPSRMLLIVVSMHFVFSKKVPGRMVKIYYKC